jgi:hypothetical protein
VRTIAYENTLKKESQGKSRFQEQKSFRKMNLMKNYLNLKAHVFRTNFEKGKVPIEL